MVLDWQNLIAIGLVATAAVYLGRRGWLAIARRRTGCGACPTCPAEESQSADGKPLVTLDAVAGNKANHRSHGLH